MRIMCVQARAGGVRLAPRAHPADWKILPSLRRLPQLGDILVVFLEATGKTMVAVTVADKVEIVRLCRMQGCVERTPAGVPDRPGRKSRMRVGVVSGLELHVG